jgi:endogenous inhibitor of DNA gyrase (YacG/DUF329 family)
MNDWVEWRCPQCGKATVQRADHPVFCSPSSKHKQTGNWIRMKRSPGAAVAEARRAAFADNYDPARA